MLALGLGISLTLTSGTGVVSEHIAITSASQAENTTIGTTIGTLSVIGGSGSYTFTKTADPDSAFTLTSGALKNAITFNYEAAPSHLVTIHADNGSGDTLDRTFTIFVTNVNEAPTVANAIPDQSGSKGSAFSFQFASNTFADVDAGTTFTYAATKSDDSALPSWLAFDATTRTFSGTPAIGDVGTLSVKVTASDGVLTVSDTFDISVSDPDASLILREDSGYVLREDGGRFVREDPFDFLTDGSGDVLTNDDGSDNLLAE